MADDPDAQEDPGEAAARGKTAVRHAEKKRTSSCGFADEVARRAIATYNETCPLKDSYAQTVLAAFIIQGPGNEDLEVVALGVGTKVCSSQGDATRVRDMHAEALARRGLLCWLYDQLEQGGGRFFEPVEGSRFGLSPSFSLHLYTSSAPCGNACVKAWARCKKAAFLELTDPFSCPTLEHPKFFVTAREQGQIAALVKKVASQGETDEDEEEDEGDESRATPPSALRRPPPPGTLYPSGDAPASLSCSDKIARWNCLGLQGALLSTWLEPLYLSSVSVGRKFSQAHCERALCCRVGRFSSPTGRFSLHHPSLLCSSVVFDDKPVVTSGQGVGVGANFSERRCFVWWSGGGPGEVLDGATGLLISSSTEPATGSTSRVCSASLYGRFLARSAQPQPSSRAEAKRGAHCVAVAEYAAAKDALHKPPFFLADFEIIRESKRRYTNT